jgi:hypothetical protein
MFFCLLPFNPRVSGLTLCFWLMVFAHWPMSSLLTPLEWMVFCATLSQGVVATVVVQAKEGLYQDRYPRLVSPSCH